jgi:hypothetical protein
MLEEFLLVLDDDLFSAVKVLVDLITGWFF